MVEYYPKILITLKICQFCIAILETKKKKEDK